MPAPLETNTRARCEVLVDEKVRSGFHGVLGVSESAYRESFRQATEILAAQLDVDQDILALVDERIPFATQRKLLGIDVDPAIFYEVIHDGQRSPYGVRLVVIPGREALAPGVKDYTQAIGRLSGNLRPTTPFEALGGEVEKILAASPAVLLPGGEYNMPGPLTGGSTRFKSLTLERYGGVTRIGHQRLDTPDSLVGILVART